MICAACGASTEQAPCLSCKQDPLLAGRYRLLAVLGRGAAGTTYRALDLQAGAERAVKEMPLGHADSPKARELLDREARVLRQLWHDGIPRYHDQFIVGTGKHRSLCLVMDLVEGVNLQDEMQERRYDQGEVLDVAEGLLEVLAYLHERSPPVIHRDLKPANVIRQPDGRLMVIDFGAVRDVLKDDLGGSTVAGTFGFMAPEQLTGDASPASDLYSLGALMVALLSRKPPTEMLQWNQRLDWKPHVAVHPAMAKLIDALLEPDPAARVQRAHQVQRMVKQVREDLLRPEEDPAPASPLAPAPALAKPTPQVKIKSVQGVKRRQPVALALAVFFVLLGAGVSLFMAPQPPTSSESSERAPQQAPAPLAPPTPEAPVAPVAPAEPAVPEAPIDISTGTYPPLGDPSSAKVEIVVFSDFECPYCARANSTLQEVKARYGSDLVIWFRDYPLEMHKDAMGAHMAARCAWEQGQFWPMHDRLFKGYTALETEDLRGYARELQLDPQRFDACLEAKPYEDEIQADIDAARAAGVKGTPQFFINGERLAGAQPLENFAAVIDRKLAQP